MKYCQNCGVKLDDNANFCIECGGLAMESTDNATHDYSSVPLLSQNSVINTVRECAKSTLFLTTLIIFTVTLILGFIISLYAANVSPNVKITINGVTSLSASRIASIVAAVLSTVPNALIVTGLWMTYKSAKDNNERMTTAGLTLIRVILIIMLILICIALPMVVIAFLILIAGLDVISIQELRELFDYPSSTPMTKDDFLALFITVLLIVVIVGVLAIIYYAKAAKTVKSIKSTVATNVVTGKVSAFVSVLAIIGGVFFALGALLTITESSLITLIHNFLNAASLILFGSVLGNYRNRIEALR